MSPYSIVLADDHVMFRKGLKGIIAGVADLEVIGEANDGLELLNLLKNNRPDLIILDISMPNLRGLEAAREIKNAYPNIKILILTMHKKKEFIQRGMPGPDGFLLKQDADKVLLQAISIRQWEKVHFASPLPELVDLPIREKKPTPEPPGTGGLKLLANGKSIKKSPISCSSASLPCAATGKTS